METNNKWKHLFTDEEWQWAHRTSREISDPKEKKEFWENLLEVKQADHAAKVKPDSIAKRYCKEILRLPGISKIPQEKPEEIRNPELKELSRIFNECIDRGDHLPKESA